MRPWRAPRKGRRRLDRGQARSFGIKKARDRRRPASPVAWVCLLIVWVVWGSTYLFIRIGVETMPPLLMAAARNVVAVLIMFPLAVRSHRVKGLRWPTRAEWLGCAIVGLLLLVANGVVGVGEKTVPSGLAALLVATVPLWLLGIDAGLLILAASAGEFSALRLAQVSTRSWPALGYLIVVGSIVAFSAYGIAVRALPTATVATYAYVNPVIAVLLGALILNERLTPAMIGGGVLIVGAVLLVVRRSPTAH